MTRSNAALVAISLLSLTILPHSASADVARGYDALVMRHALANGLPPELVHRVIVRESRYNPRAVSKGNYGLMQIRLGTARAMGYSGGIAGLLDADTNMAYAVRYLAGAYRAAGGNHDRAVALYARGYYYEARKQGFSPYATASAMPTAVSASARSAYAQAQAPGADQSTTDPAASRYDSVEPPAN